MKKLALTRSLSLPRDAVTETFAFLGKRGGGKTYAAMRLAELLLDANAQVVAIDPVGKWWSLRLAADGKSPGFPIPVFGGLRGDLELVPRAGALIADLVVDRGISAVLDVSVMRKNKRKEFVTDFAEQLYFRKKGEDTPSPLHLFVEESQVFVPERGGAGDARMLGAFEDLIKLGRNCGIGASLVSQRPQAVNKDALNQAECLLVFQTIGSQERAALMKWMSEKDQDRSGMVDELPGLETGDAYLWSPGWLRTFKKVRVSERVTFDASSTPKLGRRARKPKKLAPVDVAQLQKQMADITQEAEASDPRKLKLKVAELERALAVVPPPGVERIEVPVIDPKILERLQRNLDRAVELLAKEAEKHQRVIEGITEAFNEIGAAFAKVELPNPRITPRATSPKPNPRRPADTPVGVDVNLTEYQRSLLGPLVMRHPLGFTRTQLSLQSGRSKRSSAFEKALSQLRQAGFVQYENGGIKATESGIALTGESVTQPRTSQERIDVWRNSLSPYERHIFDEVLSVYPRSITREQLSERTGKSLTSSAFDRAISTLKKAGLAVSTEPGTIRASTDLFLKEDSIESNY